MDTTLPLRDCKQYFKRLVQTFILWSIVTVNYLTSSHDAAATSLQICKYSRIHLRVGVVLQLGNMLQ